MLIENLTLEKKQQLLTETHKETMRQARDKFEKLLQERTSQLKRINEQLRQEIEERTKAQRALEMAEIVVFYRRRTPKQCGGRRRLALVAAESVLP